jgi:hypothetical protein
MSHIKVSRCRLAYVAVPKKWYFYIVYENTIFPENSANKMYASLWGRGGVSIRF